MPTTPITSVSGIGEATAFALAQKGFKCAEDLAAASEAALSAVPGFGPKRAAVTIKMAQQLVGPSGSVAPSAPEPEQEDEGSKEKKAEKKGKKKKKQKKDKKLKKGKKKSGKKMKTEK